MKLLLTLLLVSFSDIDPTEIAKINALKEEAEIAYLAGNYEKSAAKYSYLLDTMDVEDESATLNLAHAYYQLKDNKNALSYYQKLIDAENSAVKSLAFQQLGVLSNDPKTLENALSYFKEAIKSDPMNDDARYNYELLKKKLTEQQQNQDQDQDQDQENKDQENKDEENKENKDQDNKEGQDEDQENKENKEEQEKKGEEEDKQQQEKEGEEGEESEEEKQQQEKEGEESEEEKEQQKQQEKEGEESEAQKEQNKPPSTSEKLKEMNISEEKAQMILEALRNNEIQYIQQNRRKATKKKDNDKPDW
jgi:hypothetical protein